MPELPEVETIVQDLRPSVVGRTIAGARLSHDDVLRGVTRAQLTRTLAGATIRDLTRRAKHAVFALDTPRGHRRLVVQPGMTGALLLYDRPLDAAESRYAVLRLALDRGDAPDRSDVPDGGDAPDGGEALDGGGELVYRDVRRLGTLLLLDDAAWQAYDAALGPEPLDDSFTFQVMAETFQRSRQAIKKVLMDQRFVVGVGNIYANEALFASGIDPSRSASAVSGEEYALLHHEVRRILSAAIEHRGTTFRDYVTGTGDEGGFQFELFVYGREGQPCRICGTRLTGTHLIDARTTVFCHRCQQ